jgi:hypothetical protein
MKMSSDPRWIDPDQLIFYGLIFKMARNGLPTRLSFFLPLNESEHQVVDIEVTQEGLEAMRSRADNLIARWTQGDFPATGDLETCRRCEVRLYCKDKVNAHLKPETLFELDGGASSIH